MPARPTDEELAQDLGEEYDRHQRSRTNAQTMNALLRGQRTPAEGEEQEQGVTPPTDEPADFSAAIRKAAGRPYNRKTEKE